MRFSPLTQITPDNVGNLVRAWDSHRRSRHRAPEVMKRTKFQATPLLVEDSLVFCSPFNEVIALDPGTRAEMALRSEDLDRAAPGQPLQLPRRRLLGRSRGR
jgi:Glucose dehydrogenase